MIIPKNTDNEDIENVFICREAELLDNGPRTAFIKF